MLLRANLVSLTHPPLHGSIKIGFGVRSEVMTYKVPRDLSKSRGTWSSHRAKSSSRVNFPHECHMFLVTNSSPHFGHCQSGGRLSGITSTAPRHFTRYETWDIFVFYRTC